jgi:dienelactone hydrolase
MRTEAIEYDADGLHMVSHLYYDETKRGRRPGVLVFPEAFGLGDPAKGRAERIAGLGYVALACDLHGDGRTYTQLEEVMPLLGPLMADPSRTRARAGGGLKALRARPEVASDKIASIGYCFGGTMSLELSRAGEDIAGVVGFHSGLGTARPEETKNVKPKILICIGAEDPLIPPDLRLIFEKEMSRAGADWQIHLYGGVTHSFTNPEADKVGKPEMLRYDRNADARSWASMCAFFEEIFGV